MGKKPGNTPTPNEEEVIDGDGNGDKSNPTPMSPGQDDSAGGQQEEARSTLFTQQQVDSIVNNRLREADSRLLRRFNLESEEQLKAALDRLQEFEDSGKSELEKLQEKQAALEARLEEAERQKTELQGAAKREAAAKAAGLFSSLWKYVEGDSDEEIKASIDKLLEDQKAIKPDKPEPPEFDANSPPNEKSPPASPSNEEAETLLTMYGIPRFQ